MIRIDFNNGTYTCPFCGHDQAFGRNMGAQLVGLYANQGWATVVKEEQGPASLRIVWFTCANQACGKTCISSINRYDQSQHDIYPVATYTHFPDYIPSAIRNDYEEACKILESSPKAAATLLRRCLQGMIRDYWQIKKSRLVDEIGELKDLVPPTQWQAIDALRTLGNIGAHMETDVNCIVEIDEGEAVKLLQLIEVLMNKWYIARHEEEALYASITGTSEEKKRSRKSNVSAQPTRTVARQ